MKFNVIMENLNVIDILKVGLPGLVFLLALLSFNLLSKEQGKVTPRPLLLNAIRNFMYFNIALAALTLASPIIDHYFLHKTSSDDQKVFSIEVKVSPTITDSGKATVCQNVDYQNRYLLIKNKKSERLVQVQATRLIPCTGGSYILVGRLDASNLGWPAETDSHLVEVAVAPVGYQFQI